MTRLTRTEFDTLVDDLCERFCTVNPEYNGKRTVHGYVGDYHVFLSVPVTDDEHVMAQRIRDARRLMLVAMVQDADQSKEQRL